MIMLLGPLFSKVSHGVTSSSFYNKTINTAEEGIRFQHSRNFQAIQYCLAIYIFLVEIRTSDGGNGNHSVSLPIILIKNEVDQKFPSSYISLLLVPI